MNLLTSGIILYSFYLSTCMDPEDDSDEDEETMLPPHQRSPIFDEGIGPSFVGYYTDEEMEKKFPGLKPRKGLKEQTPGGYGQPGPYPTQGPGPYPTQGPGPYPTQTPGGYPTQTPGGYPTQTPGGYGQPGPYPTQTPGGYGQPGAYPHYAPGPYPTQGPSGYGQPGPYPPGPYGAAGGYGGGASGGPGGPGQPTGPPGPPSGPPSEAPDGTKLISVEARNPNSGPNIIVDEYTAGPQNRNHRRIRPKVGFGFNLVMYYGQQVWIMDGFNYGIEVLVYPIGFSEKNIEVALRDGTKKIYEKRGKGKPWVEKK
uniref:Antigenic schizont protein n=1 Tax=Theileria lestoquardi TaxID=77054 RepID=A0A159WJ46_THELE|nr:antigenic schizont protein [Theileria lestoquardi]